MIICQTVIVGTISQTDCTISVPISRFHMSLFSLLFNLYKQELVEKGHSTISDHLFELLHSKHSATSSPLKELLLLLFSNFLLLQWLFYLSCPKKKRKWPSFIPRLFESFNRSIERKLGSMPRFEG